MSDQRILVVTGAGASRSLGHKELPLMFEWAGILRNALNAERAGLAKAMGFEEGLSAQEFEQVVGELIGLIADMPLLERYVGVAGHPPRGAKKERWFGTVPREVTDWLHWFGKHLMIFQRVLRTTLYNEFGAPAVDPEKAKQAISVLIDALESQEVVFATTNYDRSIEIGCNESGVGIVDGFNREASYKTPRLKPDGLARWPDENDGRVSVLHLHGAVGWYERDGDVVDLYADAPYNETLGTPAIVPPDPKKDPLNSPYVGQIWVEFTRALSYATDIVVVGHSLRDQPLVDAFNEYAPDAHYAVSYHDAIPEAIFLSTELPAGTTRAPRKTRDKNRSERGLERAFVFQLSFGPVADMSALQWWFNG